VGSILLAYAGAPLIWSQPPGKTIVGGLVGGWVAVEWVKKLRRLSIRTGDLFALPLTLGIALGRIGCFLTGLSDQTYGNVTSLPWGIDFGDGIRRHPTQLYEIAFLLGLALLLRLFTAQPHLNGDIFKASEARPTRRGADWDSMDLPHRPALLCAGLNPDDCQPESQ
jgi:prolipoprotein diacylglyceryltransferase